MKYEKPQLHFVGDASKLIQNKGHDVVDVDVGGMAHIFLSSKLEEK